MTEGELIISSHMKVSAEIQLTREEGCLVLLDDDPLEFIALMHNGDIAIAADDHIYAIWLEHKDGDFFVWNAEYLGNITGTPWRWNIWCEHGSAAYIRSLRDLQRRYKEANRL